MKEGEYGSTYDRRYFETAEEKLHRTGCIDQGPRWSNAQIKANPHGWGQESNEWLAGRFLYQTELAKKESEVLLYEARNPSRPSHWERLKRVGRIGQRPMPGDKPARPLER